MAAIAAVALGLLVMCGAAWTLKMQRLRMHDAIAVAAGATGAHGAVDPSPRPAREWPSLELTAVIPAPGGEDEVLVVAGRPGRLGTTSSIVLQTAEPGSRAVPMLDRWCRDRTPLSPRRWGLNGIELRPRGEKRRVRARVLLEELRVEDSPDLR